VKSGALAGAELLRLAQAGAHHLQAVLRLAHLLRPAVLLVRVGPHQQVGQRRERVGRRGSGHV